MRDPYQVLGVPSTATDDEVKKAYRNLARKYHPDNYHDNPLADLAQERMKEINEAYEEIQTQRKRGASGGGYSTGASSAGYNPYGSAGYGAGYGAYQSYTGPYQRVRAAIQQGNLNLAEELLNAMKDHDAEWNFMAFSSSSAITRRRCRWIPMTRSISGRWIWPRAARPPIVPTATARSAPATAI